MTDEQEIRRVLRALRWRRIRDSVIDWLELERSAGTLTPGLADVLTLLHQDREADPK